MSFPSDVHTTIREGVDERLQGRDEIHNPLSWIYEETFRTFLEYQIQGRYWHTF